MSRRVWKYRKIAKQAAAAARCFREPLKKQLASVTRA